jgi:hypothetical protein
MWWNSCVVVLLIALLSSCSVMATDVCPPREDVFLHNIDVFDGHPEELVKLMADTDNVQSGYWSLGFIYDAGRVVTVRCEYTDGKTLDVQLSNRVDKCHYTRDSKKMYAVYCK